MSAESAVAEPAEGAQGVRFSSKTEEFAAPPPKDGDAADHAEHDDDNDNDTGKRRDELSPEVQQELRDLSINMQKSQLQTARMQHFAYEPFSLPASRAPSPSSGSRSKNPSSHTSPLGTPSQSRPHSPPLTPATSHGKDGKLNRGHGSAPNMSKDFPKPSVLTPQESPPHKNEKVDKDSDAAVRSSAGSWLRSRAGNKKASIPDTSGVKDYMNERHNRSAPGSRQPSPSRRGSQISGGDESSYFKRSSRLFFQPDGSSDARRKSAVRDPSPSSSSATASKQTSEAEKKHSNRRSVGGAGLFAGLYSSSHHDEENSKKEHSNHSMHDLKRFFKFGHKHKESKTDASSSKSRGSSKSGTITPPHHRDSTHAMPFADDHGLESKYGKFGKVLGSGAGGSVRIMKRPGDGMIFAVKQFRERHAYESEKEYNKKVTAEFCVGSTLHHGNIIHMLDLLQEKGRWFMVMEYAPFDLFASVMTGKMSREEVTCTFMQILSGVKYLHGLGLAHRDLKLDNVVINDKGIMKIIDFGSAVAYRYPFEKGTVKASGIVGSDPYLAPEVYDGQKYDPESVDIWSLGIIFCCMALRRFPWKMPRTSDVSYKYFVSEPTPGTPTVDGLKYSKSGESSNGTGDRNGNPREQTNGSAEADTKVHPSRAETPQGREAAAPGASIKGPWRLLRLLPRESRYIVGRMLDTNPQTRANIDEIYQDVWISSRECCRQEPDGEVIRVPGHQHILEPSGGSDK